MAGPMDTEPVRVPIWVSTLGSAVIALAVDLLSDVAWRTSLIGFLLSLAPLFGAEVARARAWSPRSVRRAVAEAAATGDPTPDDFLPPPR